MSGADVAQWVATIVIGVVGSAAFWGYLKDRKVSKAKGDVAVATVEIQVEAQRVQNLESRFALSEQAWDSERASLNRRIGELETQLQTERQERAEDEREAHEKVAQLESRVRGMQRELTEVTEELATMRRMREKKPDTTP